MAYLWLFPNENIGLFTNVNGPGPNHKPGEALKVILYFIADILLQEEPWLTQETACTFPSPWRNTTSFTPSVATPPLSTSLTDYVGSYGNKIFPDVSITQDNETLKFDMNKIKGKLHPTSKSDEFQLELTDPWEYAVEKVVNENYTTMTKVRFIRSEANETERFDWFLDSWMPFQKGVSFLDDDDDIGTSDNPVSHTGSFRLSLSLLVIMLIILVNAQHDG